MWLVVRIAAIAHVRSMRVRMCHGTITTIQELTRHEEVIGGKNRFIAQACPVQNAADAMRFVKTHTDPKARHNVFAWRLADGSSRTNGDGEPGGTAGPPVLAAIDGASLSGVAVLVARYRIGEGAKLGTGGLVRAYGGTAARCLELASLLEVEPMELGRVTFSPADTGIVYSLLSAYSPAMTDEDGSSGGSHAGQLEVTFEAPQRDLKDLSVALRDATQGRVSGVQLGGSREEEKDEDDDDDGIFGTTGERTSGGSDGEPAGKGRATSGTKQTKQMTKQTKSRAGKGSQRAASTATSTAASSTEGGLGEHVAVGGDGPITKESGQRTRVPAVCQQCGTPTTMLFQDMNDMGFYCGECWKAYYDTLGDDEG